MVNFPWCQHVLASSVRFDSIHWQSQCSNPLIIDLIWIIVVWPWPMAFKFERMWWTCIFASHVKSSRFVSILIVKSWERCILFVVRCLIWDKLIVFPSLLTSNPCNMRVNRWHWDELLQIASTSLSLCICHAFLVESRRIKLILYFSHIIFWNAKWMGIHGDIPTKCRSLRCEHFLLSIVQIVVLENPNVTNHLKVGLVIYSRDHWLLECRHAWLLFKLTKHILLTITARTHALFGPTHR